MQKRPQISGLTPDGIRLRMRMKREQIDRLREQKAAIEAELDAAAATLDTLRLELAVMQMPSRPLPPVIPQARPGWTVMEIID